MLRAAALFVATMGCASAAHAAAPSPAAPTVWAPPPAQNFNGVWWTASYAPALKPVNGALPLSAAGRAAYDKSKAALKDGSLADTARSICTPDGIPRVLSSPYPFSIAQTKDLATFVFERNWQVREVAMNKPPPSDDGLLPWFMGNPVGHWDHDTLVIETKGFKPGTLLDDTGLPHSDQLKTTERLRKIDGGKALEDIVTIDDPGMFTKPFEVRYVYRRRPDIRIAEYVCGEAHRDLSSVKGAS